MLLNYPVQIIQTVIACISILYVLSTRVHAISVNMRFTGAIHHQGNDYKSDR